MKNATALRVVAKYTIGVDDVDVAAATEQGVLVTHSPAEAIRGGTACRRHDGDCAHPHQKSA